MITTLDPYGSRSIAAKEGDACGTEIFAGWKFRRNIRIEGYVLDFYCPGAKLAIELDGGGHNYRTGQIRDQRRSKLLARDGVLALRFWDHQIRQELDCACCKQFDLHSKGADKTSPDVNPLPSKGRGDSGYMDKYMVERIPLSVARRTRYR